MDDAIIRLDEFIESLGVELGEQIMRGYPHIILVANTDHCAVSALPP